ncbi:hypothetical protein FB567DRAFT_465910 [Paraphoma chrysanthemicola]|uniref:MFS general substrate transporter n=1 Tax=Paraphoma chrysanthemicola TaxID=798071 RepID=A0A8K0RE12_9PLEO|nr:hypothetical protein FB567DRAFT_465910 [Paraphoma chrysanthemicola]
MATRNEGALVTRSQQARILLSTSLAAFIIIGFTQSFGVFQVHYEGNNAVQAGVLRPNETSLRGLISCIGSFSNGGIVALFAVVYYPYLPRIGAHIKLLCCIGSVLIVLGLSMAALCRNLVQLFACQGLIQGVGAGILLYLLTPILPEYFPERSGLAQGTMFAGVDVTKASYLLAINSGVGIPSRLGAGALADKFGHQNTLLIATTVYMLATWGLWLPSAIKGNLGLYIAMSVCHGLVNGVFNTVMNSAQKALFGDETYYPKNGAMTTIRGLGYVVGIPIAGVLVREVGVEELSGADFVRPIVYVGVLLTASLVCLLNVRRLDAIRSGWHLVR